jgi:hypothetical protein
MTIYGSKLVANNLVFTQQRDRQTDTHTNTHTHTHTYIHMRAHTNRHTINGFIVSLYLPKLNVNLR